MAASPSFQVAVAVTLVWILSVQQLLPAASAAPDIAALATKLQLLEDELAWANLTDVYASLPNSTQSRLEMVVCPAFGCPAIIDTAQRRVNSRLTALSSIQAAAETGFGRPPTTGTLPPDCCGLDSDTLTFVAPFNADVTFGKQCQRLPAGVDVAALETDRRILNSGLLRAYQTNRALGPNLRWQISASEAGVFSFYPASSQTPCTSEFDARLTPWYALAATPYTKDVVVVIDTSSRMAVEEAGTSTPFTARLSIAQSAANALLGTLNPNDRVAVVAFNAQPADCFATTLAAATADNVEALSHFVDGLVADGPVEYAPAVQAAFDVLDAAPGPANDEQVVVLISAGGHPADGPAFQSVVAARNPAGAVRLVGFTFGSDVASVPDVLVDVATNTSGNATFLADLSFVRVSIGRYYTYLDLAVRNPDRDPLWTLPRQDSLLGVVTTAALPAFHNGEFVAVAALELTLTDLLADVVYVDDMGSLSYAFLIDDHGRALVHPGLPPPADETGRVSFVDISALEPYPEFQPVRTAMLNRDTGTLTLTHHDVVFPRGHPIRSGAGTAVNATVTFTYGPLTGTPYSVAVVLADTDLTRVTAAPGSGELPVSDQRYNRIDATESATCTQFGQQAIKTASTFSFAPSVYKDQNQYLRTPVSAADVDAMDGVAVDPSSSTIVVPAHLELQDKAAAITDVWATAIAVDEIWINSTRGGASADANPVNRYTAFRYVGTAAGVFRVFPGHPAPKTFDARRQPWYTRATANVGLAAFSTPHEDTSRPGSGRLVVSMSKAVVPYDGEAPVAVVGIDFLLSELHTMLHAIDCRSGSSRWCFVLDAHANLVWDQAFSHTSTWPADVSAAFVGSLYPALANELQARSMLLPSTCYDVQSRHARTVYTLQLPGGGPLSFAVGGATVDMTPVPGTTIVVVDIVGALPDVGPAAVGPTAVPMALDTCAASLRFDLIDAIVPVCPGLYAPAGEGVGTATPTPTPDSAEDATITLPSCFDDGDDPADITVAVVVGSLAFVGAVGGGAYYWYYKKKQRERNDSDDDWADDPKKDKDDIMAEFATFSNAPAPKEPKKAREDLQDGAKKDFLVTVDNWKALLWQLDTAITGQGQCAAFIAISKYKGEDLSPMAHEELLNHARDARRRAERYGQWNRRTEKEMFDALRHIKKVLRRRERKQRKKATASKVAVSPKRGALLAGNLSLTDSATGGVTEEDEDKAVDGEGEEKALVAVPEPKGV